MDYKAIAQEQLQINQERNTPYQLNIVGFRNTDNPNTFNDTLVYWYYDDNKTPVFAIINRFTTDPGLKFLRTPVNTKGCAILKSGFYKNLWKVGYHKGQYRALVQHSNCKVYRDNNRDEIIDFFPKSIEEGHFGINLHRANATTTSVTVDGWSAGCMVVANYLEFNKLMQTVDLCIKKGNQQYFDFLLINEKTDLKKEVVTLRTPQEILEEMKVLDEDSAEILNSISGMNEKLKVETEKVEVRKLGEVCKVIAGQSPEGKFYNSEREGMPFYQGKKEFSKKYIGEPTTWTTKITKEAEAGDVLMSVRAPVGPINFATQKICIGRGLAAIRAGEKIDKVFLFNFLLKHENEIVGNAGAVFDSINKTQIENIEISLPPLSEQQIIVRQLEAIQVEMLKLEKINQKRNDCLAELKKSTLEKAF